MVPGTDRARNPFFYPGDDWVGFEARGPTPARRRLRRSAAAAVRAPVFWRRDGDGIRHRRRGRAVLDGRSLRSRRAGSFAAPPRRAAEGEGRGRLYLAGGAARGPRCPLRDLERAPEPRRGFDRGPRTRGVGAPHRARRRLLPALRTGDSLLRPRRRDPGGSFRPRAALCRRAERFRSLPACSRTRGPAPHSTTCRPKEPSLTCPVACRSRRAGSSSWTAPARRGSSLRTPAPTSRRACRPTAGSRAVDRGVGNPLLDL